MLKILTMILFLPCSREAPKTGSTGLRGQRDKTCLPLPSGLGSCRSAWARTVPTQGGEVGGRGTATPSKSTRQRASEFLVAHPGSLSPKVLHQPQLLGDEVVAVAGERALEVLPRPSEKHGIRRSEEHTSDLQS